MNKNTEHELVLTEKVWSEDMNSQKERACQFIDTHRDEMVALWQELVNMESGSQNKPGIDAVADKIRKMLADDANSYYGASRKYDDW